MSADQIRDPLDLEGNEQQRLTAEDREKLAAFDAAEDLKVLMATLRGRRFMWNLLDDTGFRREPMSGVDSQTFYNLGRMAIGRRLEQRIFATCPGRYTEMIEENQ